MRKGLIGLAKFGITSGVILTLIALLLIYVLPAFAAVNPGDLGYGCQGNPCAAWVNVTQDMFFYDGNTIYIRANFSCSGPTAGLCNETNFTVTGNFSAVGDGNRTGVFITNGSVGDWAIFEINGTVNFSAIPGGVNQIQPKNITFYANASDGEYNDTVFATVVLVNMSTFGCPPADAPGVFWPIVPGWNMSAPAPGIVPPPGVQAVGCTQNITLCQNMDRFGPGTWNGTAWLVCAPQFGGATTNLSDIASTGNFSAIEDFTIEVPGKGKIVFQENVSFDSPEEAQAVMEFAMKSVMTGGKIGINESEFGGQANKPNLTLSATLTIYNVSQWFPGLTGAPNLFMSNYGGGNEQTCPTCSNIVWDGENITFTVTGFSDYGITDGINVTLNQPGNYSNLSYTNIYFNFTPEWNSTITMSGCTLYGNFTGTWANNETNQSNLNNGGVNTINLTVAANQQYIWNVYCNDTLDLGDWASQNWTVTVDTLAPYGGSESPSNNSYTLDTTPLIYVNASDDDGSGVNESTIVMTVNGFTVSTTNNAITNGYNVTYQRPAGEPFADGTVVNVTLDASDFAGNPMTQFKWSFTVDTTSPTNIVPVSPTLANNSYTANNWTYVNVTFTETNPDTCLLEYNNGTATNYTMTRTGNNCYINMTNQNDGNWNYSVYVNDSGGNWGWNGTWFITVDTTKPLISITYPSDYTNTTFTWINITGTASDTNVDTIYVNNTIFGNNVGNYTDWNFTNTSMSEGSFTILVTANDSAGNTNSTSVHFTIDRTNPTISITFPSNNSILSQSWINITGTASDTNVDTIITNNTIFGNNVGTYSNWNFTNSSIDDGTYDVLVTANDSAGNTNSSQVSFTIDDTNPLVSFISPTPVNNANQSSTSVTINVSHIETNPDSLILNWNGTNDTAISYSGSYTNITKSSLSDGVYTYYVWVNDTAGNQNQTATQTVTIDTVAPYAGSESPANNSYTSDTTPLIYVNATDHGSKVNSTSIKLRIQRNSGGWNTVAHTATAITDGYNVSYQQGVAWSDGDLIEVTLDANDSAGNPMTQYYWKFTIDTLAPSVSAINAPQSNANLSGIITVNATVTDSGSGVDTVRYNLTNSSGSQALIVMVNQAGTDYWYNDTLDTSTLADGSYNITIVANDSVNKINNTEFVSVTIDNTPPTIVLDAPTNASSQNTGITINITISDATTTVDTAWWNNGTSGNVTFTGYNISTAGWSEGITTVNVWANDTANNLNNTAYQFTFDDTAPTVTLSTPENNTNTSDTTPEFNFTVTDNLDTSLACELFVNGQGNGTNSSVGNNTIGNITANTTLAAVTHTWYINCTDDASNTGQSTETWTINIDTTAPEFVNLTTPVNNANLSGSVLVNASVTDAGSGVYLVQFNVTNATNDQVNLSNMTEYDAAGNYSATLVTTLLADGGYNITIVATDFASNINNSQFINVTIDNNPPVISAVNLNDSVVSQGQTVNITATITDAGVGIDNVTIYVNNTALPTALVSSLYQANYTAGAGNASIVVNVTANDTSGNLNYNDTVSIIEDNQAPYSVELNSPANNYNSSSSTVEFNFTVQDALSPTMNCSVYINDTLNTSNPNVANDTETNITIPGFSDGYYEWNVTCVDGGGNSNSSTETWTFTVETSAPEFVNLTTPVNNANLSGNVLVNASVTDAGTGVSSVQFNVTNATGVSVNLTTMTEYDGAGNYSGSLDTTALSDGGYNITIVATDYASNVNNSQFINVTIDNTAPAVTIVSPSTTYQRLSILINASVSDAGVGVDTVQYNVSNTTWSSLSGMTDADSDRYYNATLNTSTLQDGSYNITIVANDTVNKINNTVSVNIVVDNTAPQLSSWNYSVITKNLTLTFNEATMDASTIDVSKINVTYADGSNALTGLTGATATTTDSDIITLILTTAQYLVIEGSDNSTGLQIDMSTGTIKDLAGNNIAAVSNKIIAAYTTYNITIPETGYWSAGWHSFWLPYQTLQNIGSLSSNYAVDNVLSSLANKYTILYGYNGTAWTSYVPGAPGNTLTAFNWSTGDPHYYTLMNATGRIEIV